MVCFLVPLICAIAGLCLQVYNPNFSNTGCWVNAYPSGCDEIDSTVACERGENAYTFVLVAVLGLLCIIWVSIIYYNVKIYLKVRSTESKSKRYTSPMSGRKLSSPTSSEFSSQERKRPERRRSKYVAVQSLLFVLAYLVTWLSSLILFIIEQVDPDGLAEGNYFAVQLCEMLLFPSQGILDCLIYFRPRYARIRRECPDESRCFAFRKTLFSVEAVETIKNSLRPRLGTPPSPSITPSHDHSSGGCVVDSDSTGRSKHGVNDVEEELQVGTGEEGAEADENAEEIIDDI
jgi:hypothetical protein